VVHPCFRGGVVRRTKKANVEDGWYVSYHDLRSRLGLLFPVNELQWHIATSPKERRAGSQILPSYWSDAL